jgi:hypothetical protein
VERPQGDLSQPEFREATTNPLKDYSAKSAHNLKLSDLPELPLRSCFRSPRYELRSYRGLQLFHRTGNVEYNKYKVHPFKFRQNKAKFDNDFNPEFGWT